jgi:hypothetical protein
VISKFPDPIRREVSVEGRPPDLEVVDDVADKRLVHRVPEHRLGDTDAFLVQHRRPPAPASPLSGRREARPGVLDDQFTLKFIESGRDPVGIPPSKHRPEIASSNRGTKNPRKRRISALSEQGHVALRTFE